MHKQRLSRSRMRGTRVHRWLGDGILSKELWLPTRSSLARSWLVGFPITIVPFLPGQTLFACIAALLVRGNVLLCVLLQFLSTPLTAPVHLSACYFVGEVVRGANPREVWHKAKAEPRKMLLSAHAVTSLYLGAAIIGMIGGVVGYAVLQQTWRDAPTARTRGPFGPAQAISAKRPPKPR
jgi:uncharacterized protein (DUF2062 family)